MVGVENYGTVRVHSCRRRAIDSRQGTFRYNRTRTHLMNRCVRCVALVSAVLMKLRAVLFMILSLFFSLPRCFFSSISSWISSVFSRCLSSRSSRLCVKHSKMAWLFFRLFGAGPRFAFVHFAFELMEDFFNVPAVNGVGPWI